MNTLKQELHQHCDQFIQERIDRIQERITSIQESLTSETKNTAGDKHETGRAMLQLEREKAGFQLSEAQKTKKILAKIDLSQSSEVIRLGSVVHTTHAAYFLSISVGKINILENTYFAIATDTPIGKLLVGKKIGDSFSFNTTTHTIKTIS